MTGRTKQGQRSGEGTQGLWELIQSDEQLKNAGPSEWRMHEVGAQILALAAALLGEPRTEQPAD
jgi:hypothetical protein